MSVHAKLSPSGAHRWMACPGSVVLETGFPDTGSVYAREGTAAHELAAGHLAAGWDLADYVGEYWHGEEHDGTKWKVLIDADMVKHVKDYAKLVREYAEGGTLMVEQRVPIGHLTGEEGAGGTSDAVIMRSRDIMVVDLKYGMGLKVDAEENPQLQMYALGALEAYDVLGDFETVTMVIHQPRLNHVSEWSIPVSQLLYFGEQVSISSQYVEASHNSAYEPSEAGWIDQYLNPGEKACKFCKAKAVCPALRAEVTEMLGGSSAATADEFAALVPEVPDMQTGDNYLSIAMTKVGLVEQWCKGVRAEVERRLLMGKKVDGFKLVEGKRGHRKWIDANATEALFKSMRLRQDEMYDLSLISPTTAEKVLKGSPKRWVKVQPHITQGEGKPSVAPAADKRPALDVQSVADDFRDLL